jgi:hypothetical protein
MSEPNGTSIPAPKCPVCGAATKLKQRLKAGRAEGDVCFYKCIACGVEYPQHVEPLFSGPPRSQA